MKVGIMGAMQEEIQLIKKDLIIKSEDIIGMRQYLTGTLYSKDVVLVFSRWGKVASASTVTTLIDKFNVNFIIFTGVAGAASPDLRIGDIVIADNLLQHDMDASAIPSFQKFEIPLLGKQYFEVKKSNVDMVRTAALNYIDSKLKNDIAEEILHEFNINNPKVVTGTIVSGDQFIADTNKIKTLYSQIKNLKCVEMEGASVAQVCYEHNVPFIVIRVISDNADESANINFPKFVNEAARYFTKGIIKKILEKSNSVRDIWTFPSNNV